jgi:ribonuclease Z
MIKAKIGFNRNTKILITHLHGDHILGLPGLIQTMSLLGRNKSLQIYGPKGIQFFIDSFIKALNMSIKFPLELYEIVSEGIVCKEKEYEINSAWVEHSIPSLAYALIEKNRPGRFNIEYALECGIPEGPLWSKLQKGEKIKLYDGRVIEPKDILGPSRPGRKILYVGDTKPSKNIAKFAIGTDVMIHESTFCDDLLERAEEDMHSTPSGVALIAKRAKVKLLVLTHLSARYKDTIRMIQEAEKMFPNVCVAEDFMKLNIPLKDV